MKLCFFLQTSHRISPRVEKIQFRNQTVFQRRETRPSDLFRSPLRNINYSEGSMRGKGSGRFEQRNQSNPSLKQKDTNKSFQSYNLEKVNFTWSMRILSPISQTTVLIPNKSD